MRRPQVLALMALRQRGPLLQRSERIVAEGLAAATDFFARHKDDFHFFPPVAGPICFPGFRGDGLGAVDAQARCEALVKAAGVMLLPATCYEDPQDNLAFAGPEVATSLPHFRLGFGRLDCSANFKVLEANLDHLLPSA